MAIRILHSVSKAQQNLAVLWLDLRILHFLLVYSLQENGGEVRFLLFVFSCCAKRNAKDHAPGGQLGLPAPGNLHVRHEAAAVLRLV